MIVISVDGEYGVARKFCKELANYFYVPSWLILGVFIDGQRFAALDSSCQLLAAPASFGQLLVPLGSNWQLWTAPGSSGQLLAALVSSSQLWAVPGQL